MGLVPVTPGVARGRDPWFEIGAAGASRRLRAGWATRRPGSPKEGEHQALYSQSRPEPHAGVILEQGPGAARAPGKDRGLGEAGLDERLIGMAVPELLRLRQRARPARLSDEREQQNRLRRTEECMDRYRGIDWAEDDDYIALGGLGRSCLPAAVSATTPCWSAALLALLAEHGDTPRYLIWWPSTHSRPADRVPARHSAGRSTPSTD